MLPACIMEIVCEYSCGFIKTLINDVFARRDWKLLAEYRRHLPLRKWGEIGVAHLMHCHRTKDYEALENRARSWNLMYDARSYIVTTEDIHVFRIFARHGHLTSSDIEQTIIRLKCNENELEEFYQNKWITLLGFRNLMKRCPWPAGEAWFASKGWRVKKRRED